jgi:dihydrodipicolinate synthase/N-acetylneuraminate lyase
MSIREKLRQGLAIPAHPLALTADRKLDERRQRALTRYYLAAGAGGIAVAVHTTQFAIRDPRIGLYRPVLELAAEEMKARPELKIAGVSGRTQQAVAEAELAKSLEYDAALLSLGALRDATTTELIEHARTLAAVIPIVGFYLQPSVGGRVLPYEFWRQLTEIENLVGIKIAPFNRYQTIDVVRAVAESGRAGEIALYTGNDDNIVADLLTAFEVGGQRVRIVGGLLGHWAVWTRKAVAYFEGTRDIARKNVPVPQDLLTLGAQITDANAALFDPAHAFHGCIAGLHEILRRQGLLAGRWCLDPSEDLSPGQMEEIDRVCRLYPHLQDDGFVRENLDGWMR